MKINKISVENFQSYENINLDLSNISVAGIIGSFKKDSKKSNGSGKSTLMDIIIYSLYGKGRCQSEKELIKNGCDKMVVLLEIVINNQKIEIHREINNNKNGLDLFINGNNKTEGKKETQEIIDKLIGMDYNLFVATVFFHQDKQDNFTAATPTVRKEYLKNLLNLDIYDKCLDEIKNIYKQINNNLTSVNSQIEYINSEIVEVNEKKLSKNLKENEIKLQEYNKVKEQIEIKEKGDSLKEEYNILKKESQKIKKRIELEEREILLLNDDINKTDNQKILNRKIVNEISDSKEKKHQLDNKKVVIETKIHNIVIKGKTIKENKNCPTCDREINDKYKDKILPGLRKEINDYKSEIIKIETEERNIIYIIKILTDKYNKNEKTIKKQEETHEIKIRIEEKIKGYKREQLMKEKRIKVFKERINSFNINLDNEIDISNFQEIDRDKLISEITKIKEDIKIYNEKKKQLSKLISEKEKLDYDLNCYDILRDTFGKNGLTSEIIKNSIEEIEDEANRILTDINLENNEIRFETYKELKSKKISDTLDIFIDNRKYESYSGGQKSLINFSIRLALVSYLLGKKSIWLGVIVLDEVFGNLDEFNRNQIIKVINYLKNRFEQIFIISHTEIKDMFENTICIEYDNKTKISKVLEVI